MFAELPPQPPVEVRNIHDVYPLDFKVPLALGGLLSTAFVTGLNVAVKTEVNRNNKLQPLKSEDLGKELVVVNDEKNHNIEINNKEAATEEQETSTEELDINNKQASTEELDINEYQEIGLQIIKGFAVSERSQMIVAPSRCGKTTVMYFLLEEFFKRNPQMQCWVWQGKSIEPVHPKIPQSHHTLYQIGSEDFTALEAVYDIYKARQTGDKDRTLTKLVITDWQSIKDGLEVSNTELFKTVTTKIMTIANNGAFLGVSVVADTQSANIADWGLGSGSIRDNFDIYGVSRIEWVDGYPKGDIKALPKLINNKDILPSAKDREELTRVFEQLRASMELGLFNTSILLSTLGVCRLGITPTFERKYLTWGGYDHDITNQLIDNSLPNQTELPLSKTAQKVVNAIQYILDSNDDKYEQYTAESYISARVIYRHDRTLNSEQTKAAIDEIVQAELGVKNSDGDIQLI